MERERSKAGPESKRTEERGRWRDAAQRERGAEEYEGETMDRDRMERERLERERMERNRDDRERREGGEVVGRGQGGWYPASRDPWIASHFDFMRQFMREMGRMFEGWPAPGRSMAPGYQGYPGYGGTGSQGSYQGMSVWPPIEVEERDGRMVVRAELPGMDLQDVRVRLEGNYLLIEGERRENREREREGFYESEWNYGRFARRIPMPPGVTQDQIQATCENGVLELTIEVPGQEVREIPIQGASERDRDRGRSVRSERH